MVRKMKTGSGEIDGDGGNDWKGSGEVSKRKVKPGQAVGVNPLGHGRAVDP